MPTGRTSRITSRGSLTTSSRLRATGRDIFIIVVSAGRYDEGAGLALRSEADVFLDKPIDLDRLRRALERVPSVPADAVRALS